MTYATAFLVFRAANFKKEETVNTVYRCDKRELRKLRLLPHPKFYHLGIVVVCGQISYGQTAITSDCYNVRAEYLSNSFYVADDCGLLKREQSIVSVVHLQQTFFVFRAAKKDTVDTVQM